MNGLAQHLGQPAPAGNSQEVQQIVQLLVQGADPEELLKQGVPMELIQQAIDMIMAQQEQEVPAEQPGEGLARMAAISMPQ